MIRLNDSKVIENLNKIKTFKGFLPFQFDDYIDLQERRKFLIKNGIYEEVREENKKCVIGLRESENSNEFMDKILYDWIEKNPKFKDLIEIV